MSHNRDELNYFSFKIFMSLFSKSIRNKSIFRFLINLPKIRNLKKYIKYDDYYMSYDSCSPEKVMNKFNKLINLENKKATIDVTSMIKNENEILNWKLPTELPAGKYNLSFYNALSKFNASFIINQ